MDLTIWIVGAVAFIVGALLSWFHQRAERLRLITIVENEKNKTEEKVKLVQEMETRFTNTFKALSYEALQSNNQTFINLANGVFAKYHDSSKQELDSGRRSLEGLVAPIKESLAKVDEKMGQIEKERVGAYRGLFEQVQSLIDVQNTLRAETVTLANALRSPVHSGRWGELQLRRVVEISGMVSYCDFVEQVSTVYKESLSRPDMIIKLPGGKNVIVDAKAPLRAYLDAQDAPNDDRRRECLKEHARLVKSHIQVLSQKAYWEQFQPSPEFVVLFLPGENFFSAALREEPSLIEMGADRRVILATPTTLISLLRSIAYGWREEGMAENVREVSALGQELFGRVADLTAHFGEVGKSLRGAIGSYNKTIGTMESRVLVSLRRFQELKVDDPKKKLAELPPVDIIPRDLPQIEALRTTIDGAAEALPTTIEGATAGPAD